MGGQERTGAQVTIVEKRLIRTIVDLNGGAGSPEGLERIGGNLNNNSRADVKSFLKQTFLIPLND